MKAFVINLPKDTARLAFMEEQLKRLAIPYEVVSATVGATMSAEYKEKVYDEKRALQENRHPLSNTQIACTDSHRRVYEKIIEHNLPYALVLEDDVRLDPRITTVFNPAFMARCSAEWLQLDYLPFDSVFLSHWARASLTEIRRRPLFLLYVLLKIPWLFSWGSFEFLRELLTKKTTSPQARFFARPLYLTGAYIITRSGAEKCLPLCTPIRFAADRVQNQARRSAGLRLRGVVPLLAEQNRETFASNIIYD